MGQPRKKLSDILNGGNSGADWINDNWGDIPPAPDFGTPVPKGPYITHVIDGAISKARTGTPSYKVTHEIIEGDHKGRRLWHDIWLSAAAKSGAVRDLPKLGIKNKQQMEQPIPSRRIRCKVFVVIRAGDDGIERNEVRSFEVLGIDPPQQDAFAPPEDAEAIKTDQADAANATNKPDDNGTTTTGTPPPTENVKQTPAATDSEGGTEK